MTSNNMYSKTTDFQKKPIAEQTIGQRQMIKVRSNNNAALQALLRNRTLEDDAGSAGNDLDNDDSSSTSTDYNEKTQNLMSK